MSHQRLRKPLQLAEHLAQPFAKVFKSSWTVQARSMYAPILGLPVDTWLREGLNVPAPRRSQRSLCIKIASSTVMLLQLKLAFFNSVLVTFLNLYFLVLPKSKLYSLDAYMRYVSIAGTFKWKL
jgi:hypothetical protein